MNLKENGLEVTGLLINGRDNRHISHEHGMSSITSISFPDDKIPYWTFTFGDSYAIYATGQVILELKKTEE